MNADGAKSKTVIARNPVNRFPAIALALLWLGGCGLLKASPARPAGFIPNPAVMAEHKDRVPFALAWLADPEVFKRQKREFHKIYIPPVDTTHLFVSTAWQKLASGGTANDENDVTQMAGYMHEQFTQAIRAHSSESVEIVDRPGPGTFVLELSLVELNPTKVVMNVAGSVAGFLVPGGGLVSVTATGSIAFEAVLRDGGTGTILGTFADRQQDKITVVNYRSYVEYGYARLAVDEWAEQYAELAATDLEHRVEGGSIFRLWPW